MLAQESTEQKTIGGRGVFPGKHLCLLAFPQVPASDTYQRHWDLLSLFSVSILCSSKAALHRLRMPHGVLSHLHRNQKKVEEYYSYVKKLNKHLPGIRCFGSCLRTRQWVEWLAEVSSSIHFQDFHWYLRISLTEKIFPSRLISYFIVSKKTTFSAYSRTQLS